MTQEAMKLALEALNANYLLVNGTETHGGLEQCLDGYYSSCFDTDPINKQTEEAITALEEALAQPEHDTESHYKGVIGDVQKLFHNKREAQPEQEPVAWMDADGNVSDNNDHKCFPIPLYTKEQP